MSDEKKPTVCVTGASGFIASHLLPALLSDGYRVKATIRSRSNSSNKFLLNLAKQYPGKLLFYEADLITSSEQFDQAIRGCQVIIHLAGPGNVIGCTSFSYTDPINQFANPIFHGTLTLLQSALRESQRQSFSSTKGLRFIFIGTTESAVDHREATSTFTEDHWNESKRFLNDFVFSKTLAEKAAWEFFSSTENKEVGPGLEFYSLLVPMVLGPVAEGVDSISSNGILLDLLAGEYRTCPPVSMNVIDARDLAQAIICAIEAPYKSGRYLITNETGDMLEFSRTLAKKFPSLPLPKRTARGILDEILSINRPVQRIIPQNQGKDIAFSTERMTQSLQFSPRYSVENTLFDTSTSLIDLGLVREKQKLVEQRRKKIILSLFSIVFVILGGSTLAWWLVSKKLPLLKRVYLVLKDSMPGL